MSIAGRMSVFMRLVERMPKMAISVQRTAMVYGRRRARRTIHMGPILRRAAAGVPQPDCRRRSLELDRAPDPALARPAEDQRRGRRVLRRDADRLVDGNLRFRSAAGARAGAQLAELHRLRRDGIAKLVRPGRRRSKGGGTRLDHDPRAVQAVDLT